MQCNSASFLFSERLSGVAQALCFALCGLGSAVTSSLFIWGGAELGREAIVAALAFIAAWLLCFRLMPIHSSKELMQTIGFASAALWTIGAVAVRVLGAASHYYFRDVDRPFLAVGGVIALFSGLAGIGWRSILSRRARTLAWPGQATDMAAFVILLGASGFALGSGVGFLAGSVGVGRLGYQGDAAFLGGILGIFSVRSLLFNSRG